MSAAPSLWVPLRGGAVEVYFRENQPNCDWWFVAEPEFRVSADETEHIQILVDAELRQRQQAWRTRAERTKKPAFVVRRGRGGDAA